MRETTKVFIIFSLLLIGIIVSLVSLPVLAYYKTEEARAAMDVQPVTGDGIPPQVVRDMLRDQQAHDQAVIAEVRSVAIAGDVTTILSQCTASLIWIAVVIVGSVIFLAFMQRNKQ